MRRAASADLRGASAAVVIARPSGRGHPRARSRAVPSSGAGRLVRACAARWRRSRGLAAASALAALAVALVLVLVLVAVTIPVASAAVAPTAVAPVAIPVPIALAVTIPLTGHRLAALHWLAQALRCAEGGGGGCHLVVLAMRAAAVQVVLLPVVAGLLPDLDGLVVAVHQVPQLLSLVGLEQLRHLDVAVHHQRRVLEVGRLAPDLAEDLVGDRGGGLHEALAAAVAAVLVEHPADGLADPLPGHLHKAELADAEHVGLRLVAAQRLLERLEDLVPVLRLLHVDEVADDDAADVAEPELVDDLLRRLHVDLGDRLLEALLSDVAPGVDIDRGERLGLVDDQVAAALEPHLALGGAADLLLDSVAVEDRLVGLWGHHPLGER